MLRALLMTIHIVFVVLWGATAGLHYMTRVIGPKLHFGFPEEGKVTPDGEQCGPTTDNIKDFTLDNATSIEEAGEIMGEHGVVVVPSILQKETTQAFRDYVLKANHILPQIDLKMPENRYHIMPPHTEPIVQKVFNELAEHHQLRPLLDKLLGPEATLMIFCVVTNTYGAIDQDFHGDSTGIATYPEVFVPEFQLGIALQDTTEEMGATSIIPGTSTGCVPDWDEHEEKYNNDEDLQSRYDTFDDYISYSEALADLDVKATLSQGDGFLYHTATMHRARGHTDPDAPDRAVAFFTFVGSRRGKDDARILPLGQVYALKWNMWGRTVADMATLGKGRPWYFWKAFGLWNDRSGGVRPWNVLDSIFYIFRNDHINAAFGFDLRKEDIENWQTMLESFVIPLTFLYMLLLAFVLPLCLRLLEEEKEEEEVAWSVDGALCYPRAVKGVEGNVNVHKKVD
mmetsp:Transcript_829/g.1329  ORF Transcript_829/g.1329 Transcript_829/m.1329 type:complete len:455 (-) Transcript_829:218-1582(-)